MTLAEFILMLPFGLLLGAMAVTPIFAPRWWLRHYAKVALGLGAFTAGCYLFILHDPHSLGEAAHEYISFIALVGSLFVVSGGIHIGVQGESTPLKNVIFLLIGALLANLLGTTGAAMLLIRPWIRMNKYRLTAHHIVFFIFIVANVGGCLTPIGDPPLFLGFLQGIPFWWVAKNCWPMWLMGVGLLLAGFYFVDRKNFLRAPRAIREKETAQESWRIEGLPNLFFLAVILGAVFIEKPIFLREGLMFAAAIGSYFTTKKSVHAANAFNFHPIQEVAILFAGLFITITPVMAMLAAGLHGPFAPVLGLLTNAAGQPIPLAYFWATGLLSAFLDNAPTYLVAFELAGADPHALTGPLSSTLRAISAGAVFFGALTYIGNAPNLMVQSIAAHRGIRMPGFFGYIALASCALLPGFLLLSVIFFR